MWRQLIFVLPLILSTLAIKVPVDGKEENATEIVPVNTAYKKQDTFYVSDEANVDSYLIPPDPHRPEEVIYDILGTPATYLLPPSPEKQIDYYAPTEAGGQTDWYPIAQEPPQSTPVRLLPQSQPEAIPIFLPNQSYAVENVRGGKALKGDRIIIPSRHLEPPFENGSNEFIIKIPSEELELPAEEVNQQFNNQNPSDYVLTPIQKPNRKNKPKKNVAQLKAAEPTLALHLTPPKLLPTKHKNPTKLYPKKVSKGFQPIPIPIAQFAEDTLHYVPRAKPVKPFKPVSSAESEYFTPSDEKKIYLYEQVEQKRNLQGENNPPKQEQLADAVEDTHGVNVPAEQETSETNYRHPGRNVYPAPLRQAPPVAPPKNAPAQPAPNERTEFRMHGMNGPHSYQFGYDTGKGKNRQFRFEERDNDGRVKGHYGYMDRAGKLRVVNYDADPEHGFHAEEPVEKE